MYFTQVFKQQFSDFKHMYQTSPSYLFPAFNFAFLDSQKKKKSPLSSFCFNCAFQWKSPISIHCQLLTKKEKYYVLFLFIFYF